MVSGIGYSCAALITPLATRRLSKLWITVVLLAASAVATAALGETFVQFAYLAIGFCLCMAPGRAWRSARPRSCRSRWRTHYRGRAFAFYDMMFNVTYAIGAVIFAAFMPADGRSPAIVGAVAAGYAILAAGYWLAEPGAPVSPPARRRARLRLGPRLRHRLRHRDPPSSSAHRSSS